MGVEATMQAMKKHAPERRPTVTTTTQLHAKSDSHERGWAVLTISQTHTLDSLHLLTDDAEALRSVARTAMALAARLDAQQEAEKTAQAVPTQAEAEAQLAPF